MPAPAAFALALLCAAPGGGLIAVEVSAAEGRHLLAQGVPLDGVTLLLPAADPGLTSAVEAGGGSWGLVASGGDVVAPGSEPQLVVLEAPAGAERAYHVRRAAAALRAAFPCARLLLRADAADPLLGDPHVPASVDGVEARTPGLESWADLLGALPEIGTSVTLRFHDPLDGIRRLQHVRGVLPPPWFRIGEALANPSGRRLRVEGDELREEAPDPARPMASADVAGVAPLSAAELLARHQAALARRERLLPRLVSHGEGVVVFEVPGLSAPMTLSSEITLEEEPGLRRLRHRDLRLNGLHLGRAPRLPLLGAASDAPAPLGLAIDEAYEYRTDGIERVGGVEAWALAFRPRRPGALPSGRALLHPVTFELVRLTTVWPSRDGPFVSTRQVEERSPSALAGGHWLTSRIQVDQVYDAAGHRTPVRRDLRLARHEVPDGDPGPGRAEVTVPLPPPATVLATPPRAQAGADLRGAPRLRTIAAGVLLDPGIDEPLPFVGGSWAELDLLGTGTQLQAQLGGAFARLAWTVPELGSPRWQLRAEGAFALVEYNDRAFRDGAEHYDENLRQRPARAALMIERRMGSRLRARVGYELGFTRLRAGAQMGPGFRLPRSPLSHGLRAELHGEHGPWSALGWTLAARRASWHAWGYEGGEGDEPARDSLRGGLSVSRLVLARPRAQARLQVEAMGGRGLDRFNRFGFDALESRLQGYATNALRHEGAVVVRAAVSATPSPRLRLAAFADAARVRGSSAGGGAANHGGAGLSLETPAGPLVLAAEWARSLAVPFGEGPVGRDVVRVTLFGAF